jgi:glycosyltransferase involved in cell wall biosynthesis
MRILLNAAFDTRANAGISLYIRRLVPHLARLCDLTILTPDPELFAQHGRTIRIPQSVRFPLRRTLWTLCRLGAHRTREDDVLVCTTPAVPVPRVLPTIAVIHDLIPMRVRRLNPVKEKVAFWAGLQSLRLADRVVTDSSSTRDDFAATRILPVERTAVAYCGPGVEPSSEQTDYARRFMPFVLCTGSLAPHKNLVRLVSSFARLRADLELKLVLVGTGSQEQAQRLERAVAENHLQSRVVLLTTLSDPQLSSLYRHCRMMVCPSVYEGFGLPLLEAMLHGAPVACSSVSSLPEVAGGAAVLFDPRSVGDMTDKLQRLLDDPCLSRRLSELGLLRATRFTWERTAETVFRSAAQLCGVR